MKVICSHAEKCESKMCPHKTIHEHSGDTACEINYCNTFNHECRCESIKEEPMEQKLEGLEIKHTILADQDKKTDAGKLRYDLIEYEIIDEIDFRNFNGVDLSDPLAKYREASDTNLKLWITVAVISLGGWNNFLKELARVYTFGAEKYGDYSWKTVPNAEARYLGAMQRHIYEFQHGNYVNFQDGMLYHSAQIAWNAISLLWLKQNKGE